MSDAPATSDATDPERVLRWYGHILLSRHRALVLATVGRDGVPHLAALPYRQDGEDLYVLLPPDSPAAADLSAVGPIAALVLGGDGTPVVHLGGAAEAVADPTEGARLAGGFGRQAGAAGGVAYHLTIDELRPQPGLLETRALASGETVVRQGDLADRFYVILDGECEVVRGAGGQPVARLGPGDFFGETGLLAGVPRTATVVAATAVHLVAIGRSAFGAALADPATPTAEELARVVYATARG